YGRQPKYAEVVKPMSRYSISSYEDKFGTWRKALEEFIKYVNSNEDQNKENNDTAQVIELNNIKAKETKRCKVERIKRTPRKINLRMRWLILQRDNFSCNKCGASPAKTPSIVLHVDH